MLKKSERPGWISSKLSQKDFDSIEQSIHQAELKTSGEIVPMIVRRSSTIGHIPLTLLMILTNFWLIGDWIFHFYYHKSSFNSPLLVFSGIILVFLLTRILSPMNWIERLLTPKQDQALQVEQRAEIEFFESDIKKTKDSTGILLMLSLMEHRAVVLADRAISEKLPPEIWDEVIKTMISGVKNKNIAQGMIDGIKLCGELLSKHFPIKPDDTNELSNQLIVKD